MHYLSTPGDRCEIIFQGLDALWPQSDCGYSTCRIVACEKLGPFGSPKILGPWLPYPRINASGHHMDTTGRHMVTTGHHMIATGHHMVTAVDSVHDSLLGGFHDVSQRVRPLRLRRTRNDQRQGFVRVYFPRQQTG